MKKSIVLIALILISLAASAQKVVLLDTTYRGNRHIYYAIQGDIRVTTSNDSVDFLVMHVQKQRIVGENDTIQRSMNLRIPISEIRPAFNNFLNSNNFKARMRVALRNDYTKKISQE